MQGVATLPGASSPLNPTDVLYTLQIVRTYSYIKGYRRDARKAGSGRKDDRMRSVFSIVFTALILALGISTSIALCSPKKIGKWVALLNAALIPPVLGNLMIVSTAYQFVAVLGYYIYSIGMDAVVFSLCMFTEQFCSGGGNEEKTPRIVGGLLLLDVCQLLVNPIFGHAFRMEQLFVEGRAYYRMVPLGGQLFHRIVDYSILGAIIVIFCLMVIKTPRAYREKYFAVLLTMIAAGMWQSFYVFSRRPIDRSMIGLVVFGLMIFYFALYYRPLLLLDRLLSNMASELPEALFFFDPNRVCIWANSQGLELIGLKSTEVDQAGGILLEMFGSAGDEQDTKATEFRIVRNGVLHYYMLEEHVVKDPHTRKLTGTYLQIRDVTEEKQKLKAELYDATHDRLTGLYTREYLYQCIAETLKANRDRVYLVIFVDVRNFKVVNDVFGSDFGDYALQRLADWVRNDVSDRCHYGRLAGDTFGVLIPREEFDAERIEAYLTNFTIKKGNAEYHLLVHLGIYEVERYDTDVSVMFDRAHLSLSTIKESYHTHIAYYDNEIRRKLIWDQEITAQLQNAIRDGQICAYLQPIADTSGKIVGAEALARWKHPEHGFLAPGLFIPVFEKNGMIIEVDKFMWRTACEVLQRWGKQHRDLFISVNISPKDFYFMDVVAEIKALVREYAIEPAQLRIEITETVMMNDSENRMRILSEFRKAGFIVEMDDFGSGFSSLNMLKDMPVDVLKIDMKFLGKTSETKKAQIIVKNIIHLSRELGITALTEGVETQRQYRLLMAMGCKLFQGYYFAKPMPIPEFESFAGF